MRRLAWVVSLSLLCSTVALGQVEPTGAADAALAAKDWAQAEKLARELTQRAPKESGHWLRLASAQHGLSRYDEELVSLEAARKAGAPTVMVTVRKARALSRLGKLEPAFAELDAAVGQGWAPLEILEKDPDFEKVRGSPKFQPLLLKAQKVARPCEHDALSRQFDFWVGEWDVSTGGSQVGKSRIERILNSCVLLENWESPNSTGKSFNLYDHGTKHWRQTWVDSSGTVTDYTGGLTSGGAMQFLAEQLLPRKAKLRMTFTPMGKDKVRQLIEESPDGKTWTVSFDGLYQRRGS
jgi:hypothetical protein